MSDPQITQDPLNDPLTDHEYDGIREYDNPIPMWWHWIFMGTFIFSIFYFAAHHMGTAGTSVAQAYENEKEEVGRIMLALLGDLTVDEPTILSRLNEEGVLSVGAGLFAQNCVSCHGKDGEGLVGPNLTDDHYKNLKTLGEVGSVIQNGAANGAMPAWNNRLSSPEIVAVAAYVAQLRGKNLPGPRGQEGEVIPLWPDAPPASTVPAEAVETPQ
jgi:cytochrome c oxidase cbb3-type subunit 3